MLNIIRNSLINIFVFSMGFILFGAFNEGTPTFEIAILFIAAISTTAAGINKLIDNLRD